MRKSVAELLRIYQPKSLSETIWPEVYQEPLSRAANALAIGTPGTGKSAAMHALLKERNYSFIYINGSDKRGLDVVRDTIVSYISNKPVENVERERAVFIDEIDGFTPQAFNALRSVMEHSAGVHFFATANNGAVIPDAIKSRFTVIHVDAKSPEVSKRWCKRILDILNMEGIEVSDQKVLASTLKKIYPDFRKALTSLWMYVEDGALDCEKFQSYITSDSDTSSEGYANLFNWILSADTLTLMSDLRATSNHAAVVDSIGSSDFLNWLTNVYTTENWVKVVSPISILYTKYRSMLPSCPDGATATFAFLSEIRHFIQSIPRKG